MWRSDIPAAAEGHSNASLAAALSLSERTVMAHMRSVFTKLGLVDDGTTHRRLLTVVTYFGSRQGSDLLLSVG